MGWTIFPTISFWLITEGMDQCTILKIVLLENTL
jgi:hypothetical protein